MTLLKCPYCGWEYEDHVESLHIRLVPTHDFPKPCRAICPGSSRVPRDAKTDTRPLLKDEPCNTP